MMSYEVIERGSKYTLDYKVFFCGADGIISPLHDIPLYADKDCQICNMVVEIPRWTNAKLEMSMKEKLNPITQDVKKGQLRFVNNCFPYQGYIWNYGAFPQTWEDPSHVDIHTSQKGDNDPLDVCEIGSKVHSTGSVIQVKILGCMALIDEGETDWKVIAIDIKDPIADKLDDIDDVETHMPGLLQATHEWFRIYKIPTGKPANVFAFDGRAKGRSFTMDLVEELHEQWRRLVTDCKVENIAFENTSFEKSDHYATQDVAVKIIRESEPWKASVEINPEVDRWCFVE